MPRCGTRLFVLLAAFASGCVLGTSADPPATTGGAGGAVGARGSGGAGSGSGGSTAPLGSGGAGTSGSGGGTGAAPPGSGGAGTTGSGGAPAGGGGSAGGSGGRGGATGTGGILPIGGRSGTGGAGTGIGGTGVGGQTSCDGQSYDAARPPMALSLSGSLGTHDPSLIRAGDRYYLFHTGRGIPTKTSTNLTSWTGGGAVFSSNPSWIAGMVPGVGDLWAPDISYFGGMYHLYYSASTFGENRSCIGHATRAALDSGSWMDRGPAICSNTGSTRDDWNAIDPNVVIDDVTGTPYLVFGSFWSGIKMIQLDQTGARVGTDLRAMANRPSAGGALEAPYIIKRCGYYYLFVSWDRCCQGVNSTYNIRVGRSTSLLGPYMDKAGTAMSQGGGTLVLEGNSTWHGPGHNAVIFSGGASYNVYHAYNGPGGTLRISELAWDASGWPVSGGP